MVGEDLDVLRIVVYEWVDQEGGDCVVLYDMLCYDMM